MQEGRRQKAEGRREESLCSKLFYLFELVGYFRRAALVKFGRKNSWYPVAGLVTLVSLMGYVPELRAQEEPPSLVGGNDKQTHQTRGRTGRGELKSHPKFHLTHQKEELRSIKQEQATILRSTLEAAHNLNQAELPLLVEDEPVEAIQTPLETANNNQKEEELRSIEPEQATILRPTLETTHTLNKAELLLPVESHRVETLQPSLEIANDTNKEDWPSPINDTQTFWLLLIEQLEYRNNEGADSFNWEALGWIGGDYRRLWLKTEGDVALEEDEGGEAEVQLLYGQLIAPFWDFQAGLRYDRLYGPGDDRGRAFAVIGLQGLAPYLFEVDTALFVSEDGDVSARLSAEYQLLLTQRLILQPEFEVNVAAQQVEDFGVGSGFNDIELGLRLRYEISRQFAPYVGISWTRQLGDTADFVREEGGEVDNFALVGGLRLLF